MQLNVVFIATALFASASLTMSATITGFDGAGCSGTQGVPSTVLPGVCFSLGDNSKKSIGYSDVPNNIEFFLSGGDHNLCTNGAFSTLLGGSGPGCLTAPAG
jgi:hypothetical protein